MSKKGIQILTLFLLAGLVVLALRHLAFRLTHPWPLEYGEGINLLWARATAEGAPLYPSVSPEAFPQVHNPYPPLSPLLTSLLGTEGILPGRRLSLLGLILSATALFRILREHTSRNTAAVGVLVFLLSPVVLRYGSLMRVDMLALGLSLTAFHVLHREKSTRRFALAAVLAALALLVKSTFIATAGFVLLSLCRHRTLRHAGAAALGALIPFVSVVVWLFSRETPELMQHLWTLQGLPTDPAAALRWLGGFANLHALWLCGGLALLAATRSAHWDLRVYAALAWIAPLGTLWISGSDANYLLEVWATACLAAPLLWDRIREKESRAAWALLFAQLCLFLPVRSPSLFTRTYGQEIGAAQSDAITPTAADLEIGRLLSEELRTVEGPVLGSEPGMLLLTGHDLLFQPYQFSKLARAGHWDTTLLEQGIQNRLFSHILLKGEAATQGDPYLPPDIQKQIEQAYELHRVIGPWDIYRR